MNAYLFSAGYTTTQLGHSPGRGGVPASQFQTWDGCTSAVSCDEDAELAQSRFEDWLMPTADAESSARLVIKRMVAAQFVDQLLTESGAQPLDWAQVTQEIMDRAENSAADDSEQGYWVDLNRILPAATTSPDVASLRQVLPDDIRSGLNWAADKQFYFLVSILSSAPLPAQPPTPAEDATTASDSNAEATVEADLPLDYFVMSLLEMRDKEAAALVQARNSVVAAWLWRKYAADTRLANHPLHITPCCAILFAE